MATLQRLIAHHVISAMSAREHLSVSAGSHELLAVELEAAIAPLLPSVTPYLMAAHGAAATDQGFGDRNADEAVAVMVDAIGERLARSNHVDDIYADDARIRRDALRVTRELLLRAMRGQLEIEDDATHDGVYVVQLDALGYVVATAAKHAHPTLMRRALAKAARRGQAELESYDADGRVAIFRRSRAHRGLLAIEETIAGELGRLIEAGRIALPAIEQLMEVPARLSRRALPAALEEAARSIERQVGCRASCTRVSKRELLVSLTPLTAEVAQQAEAHLEMLIAAAEAALAGSERASAGPASHERSRAPAPAASRRRPRRGVKEPVAKEPTKARKRQGRR